MRFIDKIMKLNKTVFIRTYRKSETLFFNVTSFTRLLPTLFVFFLKAAYKSFLEATKVHFTTTLSMISLLQRSTMRPLTLVMLSTWKFRLEAFLFTTPSQCTVQLKTYQISRDGTLRCPLQQQTPGLFLVLWEQRKNFGVLWTGSDFAQQW